MPPRLRPSQLPTAINVIPSSCLTSASPLLPFLLPSFHVYITCSSLSNRPPTSRQFSTSKPNNAGRGTRFEKTFGRRNGFTLWLKEHGRRLNDPSPSHNVPVYLSYEPRRLPLLTSADRDRNYASTPPDPNKGPRRSDVDWEKAKEEMTVTPFPTNPIFKVHPVISTEFREQIYQRIKAGRSVRRVSAELNCELERVAAVVRLKEIEKMWSDENRPLCTAMQQKVHALMPVTAYKPFAIHESITDLRIHAATNNQLFLSTSESAPFGRKEAGKALGILPADVRMPHSELVEVEKMKMANMPVDDMIRVEMAREKDEAERLRLKKEAEEERKKSMTVVETDRWRFRLKPALTGQVGFRYGAPHEDRKRGQVKIPKRVV